MSFSDNVNLEVIEKTKLLGIIINTKLKWNDNTDYICDKARKKLWLIRNMKISGLTQGQLIDAYTKEVRSLLELAVPVWNSNITLDQSVQIERLQKSALSIILGFKYQSYENALEITGLKRLSYRREQICSKFISKNMKSDKPLLSVTKKSHDTRSNPNLANEIQCRTQAFYNSSLPYLARLYNRRVLNIKSGGK